MDCLSVVEADRSCLLKMTDYIAKWIWPDRDVIQQGSPLCSQPRLKRVAEQLILLFDGDCGGAAAISWVLASCYGLSSYIGL